MSMTSRGDALPKCGCGGGPALVWTTKKRTPRTYQRICSLCVISTGHYDTEAEADAAWTRAMSAAPPAMARPSRAEALPPVTHWATELLRLYDLRFELAKREKAGEDVRAELRKYGDEKKQGWIELRAALAGAAQSGMGVTVEVKAMQLSGGRCDYFVSFKCGDREVTPHSFRERFKAEYHVALYQWLFGQGDEPDLLQFSDGDWPAMVTRRPAPQAEGGE